MTNSNVEIEPLGDGIAIHLPYRQLGSAKRIGWLPLAFGVFVSLFMIGWIATPVFWGIEILKKGEVFGWLFIGFGSIGLIGLYHTMKILAAGISILNNQMRCTVTVNESQIVNREKFGWFSHKYKFKRSDIEQLFVVPISSVSVSPDRESSEVNTSGLIEFLFGDNHHLQFTITPQKRGGKLIAAAYPRGLLDEVAETIAEELNRNQTSSVTIVREANADAKAASPSTVTVSHLSEEDVAAELEEEKLTLPADSALELVKDEGSIVIKVPQKGLARGSGGLFVFSVIWNSFLLFFTYGAFAGKPNGGAWGLFPILGVFWAVGIGMLVGSIYMARQRAMIGVRDGLLFIERNTMFGTKWTEFAAEEIDAIEMAHANMEVNGKPVMNLHITPLEGKPVKMFSHLENGELRWLAQELRASLGVASTNKRLAVVNFDAAEPIAFLESSDIETKRESNRVYVDIPPTHFSGEALLRIMGMAFVLLPLPAAIAARFLIGGVGFEMFLISIFLTLVGILMVGVHRYATTRHGRIVVSDESIEATIRGFMSKRNLKLSQPDVISVDVVDSGIKVGDKTMHCLKIKGKGGRAITMMTGRSDREITHVAKLIHLQLKLTSPKSSG